MKIKDCMTENIEVVGPENTLQDIAIRMRDGDFGAIPVLERDRLIGFVTDRDIVVRAVATGSGDLRNIPVRQIMSGQVQYCFENDEAEDVARMMGDNQLRRLPVLNENKRLVGIVALGDLALARTDNAGSALGGISRHVHSESRH